MTSPVELRYSKEHEWVRVSGDRAVIGITAPAAGELWCFPGHLLHAVMPRELLDGAGGSSGAATHRRGLRISVAFNVYCKSSPFRDASIGYRGEDASAAKMQFGNLRSCSLSCLEPRKSNSNLKHE